MSARSEGAMDNVTETANCDDFDTLLEGSSLGAPRVIAAIGTAPPAARQRFDHAARHPQAVSDEDKAAPAYGTQLCVHEFLATAPRTVEPQGRTPARTLRTVPTGTGRTAVYLGLLHRARLQGLANGDAAVPRRILLVVSRRELLNAALFRTARDGEGQSDRGPSAGLRFEPEARCAPAEPFAWAPPCDQLMAHRAPAYAAQDVFDYLRGTVSESGIAAAAAPATRNAVMPLYVMDDEIDRGPSSAEAGVVQAAPLPLDGYARMQSVPAALRFHGEHPSQRDAQECWRGLQPSASVSRGKTVMLQVALAWCMQSAEAVPSYAVPLTCASEERSGRHIDLQRWWMLRAVLADGLWQVSGAKTHAPGTEQLWSAAIGYTWPPALELPCLKLSWEPQMALWTPGPSRPCPQHTPDADMSASRPRQTSDAGALRTRHTVETETTGRLHLDTQASITLPLPTHINYRATDPYAVEAVFTQEDGDVTWTFSRELLADGMHARAGTGDVAIWPGTGTGIKDDAQIFIELSPPSGTALVSLPRACVEEFLNQTTSIVPAGAEHTYISPTLQELERQLNQLARHPGGCE